MSQLRSGAAAEYEAELRKISDYAQKFLDPVLKPMLESILMERPDNVVQFMLKYLNELDQSEDIKLVFYYILYFIYIFLNFFSLVGRAKTDSKPN
jgi:hypothetical protein